MRIEAKGTKHGRKITITVTGGTNGVQYRIDGVHEILRGAYLDALKAELHERHVVAGTYVPPEDNTHVNILNVLQYYYFDDNPQIKADGIDEMPHEEGVVY